MSEKRKQFGVWLDNNHAIIVGREDLFDGPFVVLGHINSESTGGNSSEKTFNNHKTALLHKYFKDITSLMQNIDELLVTGPGIVQEQFMHYLAETAQYKNAETEEKTSNKMSDENLLQMVTDFYHYRLK